VSQTASSYLREGRSAAPHPAADQHTQAPATAVERWSGRPILVSGLVWTSLGSADRWDYGSVII
jgi:hypothetical protein